MIHVVAPEDYANYRTQLAEMHRLRYRVFHQRLGWDVAVENGEERDHFDSLEPIYLLATDDNHSLVGSWRFLSTTGPYMLRDVFPQLLEGQPAPRDICIWEGSRFAVERSLTRSSSLASISLVAGEMLCAVIETCMAVGVRELITVYDIRMGRLLHRMGCPPRWQSRPHKVGQAVAMAGHFDMTVEVLDSIRAAMNQALDGRRGPQRISTGLVRPRSPKHGDKYVQAHGKRSGRAKGLSGVPPKLAAPASIPRDGSA